MQPQLTKKIGIASPIQISSLAKHLDNLSPEHLTLGLGGTAVNTIINGLIDNGVSVSVYTLDQTKEITKPLVLRGPQLTVYIGTYRPKGRHRMLDFFRYEAKQIQGFIEQDKPDIVNAHWSYEFALGAIWSKYPHLITFRDTASEILRLHKDPYRLVRFFLDLQVKKTGSNFNVNSVYLQQKLQSPRLELPVIPNPVNEAYLAEQSKHHPTGTVKIVAVLNGWSKRKNATKALQAFKLLRQEFGDKVMFDIYGPGYAEKSEAQKWAQQNNCVNGVRFMGSLEHTELMDSVKDYDILLHPAIEESFGNTLLEGLALGLPVVAGESSGAVPWVLNFGKNGLLVNVTDEHEIYKALKKLITNSVLYEALSQEGIHYVKERFTSKMIAASYLSLYDKIIKQSHSNGSIQKNKSKKVPYNSPS
ncbi:glycosyltransferase family 4 protein [Pontibacter silvestris]|uniref:Glycosyltransferase family 4 protein n=1 Tax=Pontibacter silvestris TaxID=2305183 RepID=A0ABW4X476_9BACT|nr:glycosyltransferase family 4 protein [Pontibacter silvestris]MCC9135067.1 glycosyltransferase family 4 protein [Pontibacter silvestris]